jgi:phosphatidylglycerol lysyltransferase
MLGRFLVQWLDMDVQRAVKRQLQVHRQFAVQFLSILVAAHGVYILAASLLDQIAVHHGSMLNDLAVDVPLMIGLSLLYLSSLLRRRKRTAWLVTVLAYTFYIGIGVAQLLNRAGGLHDTSLHQLIRLLLLPLVVLGLLFLFRKEFVVKSDIQGFGFAARFIGIVLAVTLVYGIAGFELLDHSDFHQEINLPAAAHYTIDQFNITTVHPLQPYTKRAHLFVDSLSFVSLGAVIYAAIALFQPLRLRLSDQHVERERMAELLRRYGGPSEEFFKLWPHDKQYFFDESGRSGLAFHVSRGIALCLSDPAGDAKCYPKLMRDFENLCFSNDWLPAMIHVADTHRKLYEKHDFMMQKLGQEAVLDLAHFQANVADKKYFRQISNKFTKQGVSCELLQPPHHQAVLDRLGVISAEWLSQGGRAERKFVMGYYTPEYLQLCKVMVARDAAGTIQAFINLVPADFDQTEATYDLLRHASKSLGNINDYLLMNLIERLAADGYKRLNLGLCPLAGLDEETDEEKNQLIDGVLRFAYANGDRFYSFSGLHRFKAKYEPEWRDRYVAYQGGVRGFSRTMTALMRTMRI